MISEMAGKFQQYSVGGIPKVPLGGGWHTYGQMTGDAEVAFFDAKTRTDLPTHEIVGRPVLFRVGVYGYAVSRFVWPKVGRAPLPEELRVAQPQYIQDALNP